MRKTSGSARKNSPGWQVLAAICLLASLSAAPLVAAPVITSQPAATAVVAGNNAALSVTASGGSLAYQWFRGNVGDTSSPVTGATGTLLVSPPLRSTSTFWVRVSDGTGATDSQGAMVSVTQPRLSRVMTVGYNYFGQLGDGTTINRTTPVQVAADAIAIAAGRSYNMFIKADGTLWGMGDNFRGQLGDGTLTNRTLPKQVAASVDQVSINAVNGEHSHFIKSDGSLWSMGQNSSGQLGDGSNTDRLTPVQIATGVAQVTAGTDFTFILKPDGTLLATGANDYGKLGDGTTTSRNNPITVATGVAAVAAGSSHSLFLKTDGRLLAVGEGYGGRLGDGTGLDRLSPVQVATYVVALAAGYSHSLFLKSDGTLWAMGSNNYGQLGVSTYGPYSPLMVASQVKWVRTGSYHTFFGRDDDTLWASGNNFTGQLADNTVQNRSLFAQSSIHVAAAEAGDYHSLYLDLAPSIATQPMDVNIAANGSTVLSVSSNSHGLLTYQWFIGNSGDTSQPVAGADSATFTTPAIAATAHYWTRITSPYGSVDSRTVTVRVVAPPQISNLSPAQSVSWDESAALQATVAEDLAELQWYEGASGDTSKPIPGATAAKLVSPPLRASTSYWLRASNAAATFQSPAIPVTLVAPRPNRLFSVGNNSYGQLGDGTTISRSTLDPLDSEIIAASGGQSHSLYLSSGGSLRAMGRNSSGQLGDGTTTSRPAPVTVVEGVKAIAAGGDHSLFIRNDGSLWGMGSNHVNQLGDGTTTARSTPVQIAQDVIQVTAGSQHSIFLKSDGTLWGMGNNGAGQLGDGTNTNRSTPVLISQNVVTASAGGAYTLFVKTDGSMWATGYNTNGQLADGTGTSRNIPVQVATGVARVSAGNYVTLLVKFDGTLWATKFNVLSPSQIAEDVISTSAGYDHGFFVKSDRSLWAVGTNSYGQLADGTTTDRPTPVLIRQSAGIIAAGYLHTLLGDLIPSLSAQPGDAGVLLGGSTILTVGANGPAPLTYQWYIGETGDISSPVSGAGSADFQTPPASATTTYWVRVSSPYGSADSRTVTVLRITTPVVTTQPANQAVETGESAALTVAATGGYFSYQWHQGNAGDTSKPITGATGSLLITRPSQTPTAYWVRITNAAGSTDSQAATVTTGVPIPTRLLATGGNSYGQLGTGTASSSSTPAQMATQVIQSAAGTEISFFIRDNGDLWGTGRNNYGQLGTGSTGSQFTPVPIATQVAQVAAGSDHTLFVKTDGTLWAMGSNSSGRLGDGTTIHRSLPVMVATNVVSAAAGVSHSLFLKTDGTLWAMGSNSSGQLGDGTSSSRNLPVQVADSVAMVAAGDYHSLFLKTDGTLWAMGSNSNGQLGDGTTTGRLFPVQVASGVARASAGSGSSFFVKSEGSLWATGYNYFGILGTGNTDSLQIPAKIADAVKSVVAGDNHSLFLKADNTLWATGDNRYGEFGDGSTTDRLTPIQVASSVAAIATDESHSLIRDLLPAIDVQPADAGVAAGATPTLAISVSGGGTLSYQWYAGTSGNTANPISGANSATYQTPPVASSASYWVRVTSPYGIVDSRTTMVQPVTPPLIGNEPQATVVALGANASLSVSASGGMLLYQWFQGQTGDISTPVAGASGPLLVTSPLTASGSFWVRISNATGFADSIAVTATVTPRTPGYLRSVGSTDFGQLGTGAMTANFLPAPITTGVAKVASGGEHSLILKTDGSLWAIGLNSSGQLGDGTTISRSAPVPVTTGVTSISAGPDFSAFVKTGGTLWVMGYANGSTPRQIATGVSMACAGYRTIYFLSTGGSLTSRPITSPLSGGTFVSNSVASASASYLHLLFIKTDATLWGTGVNSSGELGSISGTGSPVQLSSGVSKAVAGMFTSYFVKTDGSLWGLGNNSSGQLGESSIEKESNYPIAFATGVTDVAANGSHAMFVKTDASLWGVGLNSSGQLGDGTAASRSVPVLTARQVSQVSAGSSASLFVTSDGTLWGTGSNKYGQLGDSATPAGSPAGQVTDNVVTFSAGNSHSLLIKADGTLWSFGSNAFGQLGDGTQTSRATPVPVATGVAHAAAGNSYSLFVKSDGTLWATGKNDQGQLGDGTRIDRTSPIQLASDVSFAAAGTQHSLFLKTDGSLWTTGDNSYGQLGDATNSDRLNPVQIATSVVMAAAGNNFSLFLKNDGTLWAAGYNPFGQLGDGTTVNRYLPVQVASGVIRVAAGSGHGHFLKSDGSLWSMGNNSSGQLGDGSNTTSRSTPVQVATGVATVVAGTSHSLFMKPNGTLCAMGYNSSNQLGDGTTTSWSTPVQVGTNVLAASAGGAHSLWLAADAGSLATAITSYPASSRVTSGGTAALSVAAIGSGTLTYQWYAGLPGDISQPVTGATSPNFTTPPIASSAPYWVRVTGASGFANSRAARLTVVNAPTIVTQPAVAGTLPEGGVRLSVTGSAETFSYQWFTGPAGDVSHPVPGATSATIFTLPVKTTTSFWVRLENSSGTVDSAAVTVSKPPAAGRYLKTAGASYGGSLTQRDGSVASVSTGNSHCLFVKTSGTLWAMGSNSSGQFGNGSTNSSSSPVRIIENVATAAAGAFHSLFVKTDGTLWAMGANSLGQLGDGTTSGRSTPVLIARDVASVAAGDFHSLFVKTDGTLWAMGANTTGKLGDGTSISRSVPVQISDSVVMAAAGRDHSLFVKTDGSLWGMGANSPYGQLGFGTSASVTTPAKIADGVVAISAGYYHSLFITSDGTLRAMGYNSNGQVGYGATDSEWSSSSNFILSIGKLLPPHIIAANISMVAAGGSHSLWVKADGSLWSSGTNTNGQLCTSGTTPKPPAKVQDRTSFAAAGGNNSVILTTNSSVEPPAIVVHPASTVVPSGSPATFSVTATGAATLAYQWYLGPTGDTSQPIAAATSNNYTSSSLSSGTELWVRVSNSAAYSESRTATLVTGSATSAYLEWVGGQDLSGIDISPSADPDGDQRSNLLEYATGSAGGRGDSLPPAAVVMDSAAGLADFHIQLRGDPGLRLTCLLTPDFTSWQDVPLVFSGATWSTGNSLLQIINATPGEGNLWNLTLRHEAAPHRLFLQTTAEMVPAN